MTLLDGPRYIALPVFALILIAVIAVQPVAWVVWGLRRR